MIEAAIFDLDGTLVQTERLKAVSYARAAHELRPDLDEDSVIEAFKDVVGMSRQEVATRLMDRFDLESAARSRMAEFGVQLPWQAYVGVRLQIYDAMLQDAETVRSHRWPHTIQLLEKVRGRGCRTALATMSHRQQVRRILEILQLEDKFDFIATRDDVERPKPDPEIYQLVAHQLGVAPRRCLVIEDSPAGVRAAVAARMEVVAMATPFTHDRLLQQGQLPHERIAEDPDHLLDVVAATINGLKDSG